MSIFYLTLFIWLLLLLSRKIKGVPPIMVLPTGSCKGRRRMTLWRGFSIWSWQSYGHYHLIVLHWSSKWYLPHKNKIVSNMVVYSPVSLSLSLFYYTSLFTKSCYQLFENPAHLKSTELKISTFKILSLCVKRYDHLPGKNKEIENLVKWD